MKLFPEITWWFRDFLFIFALANKMIVIYPAGRTSDAQHQCMGIFYAISATV